MKVFAWIGAFVICSAHLKGAASKGSSIRRNVEESEPVSTASSRFEDSYLHPANVNNGRDLSPKKRKKKKEKTAKKNAKKTNKPLLNFFVGEADTECQLNLQGLATGGGQVLVELLFALENPLLLGVALLNVINLFSGNANCAKDQIDPLQAIIFIDDEINKNKYESDLIVFKNLVKRYQDNVESEPEYNILTLDKDTLKTAFLDDLTSIKNECLTYPSLSQYVGVLASQFCGQVSFLITLLTTLQLKNFDPEEEKDGCQTFSNLAASYVLEGIDYLEKSYQFFSTSPLSASRTIREPRCIPFDKCANNYCPNGFPCFITGNVQPVSYTFEISNKNNNIAFPRGTKDGSVKFSAKGCRCATTSFFSTVDGPNYVGAGGEGGRADVPATTKDKNPTERGAELKFEIEAFKNRQKWWWGSGKVGDDDFLPGAALYYNSLVNIKDASADYSREGGNITTLTGRFKKLCGIQPIQPVLPTPPPSPQTPTNCNDGPVSNCGDCVRGLWENGTYPISDKLLRESCQGGDSTDYNTTGTSGNGCAYTIPLSGPPICRQIGV